MPFKSKKQAKFIKAVAHGMKPRKKGLSKKAAQKMVRHDKAARKGKKR